jgi:hypothetical protein
MFACNDNLNNLGVGINWSGDLDLPKFSTRKDFECVYLDMPGPWYPRIERLFP